MINITPEQQNLPSSNLGRLCELRNKAKDFVQYRGSKLLEPHENLLATDEVTKLARILLRLANDTFLAVPFEQCRTINQFVVSSKSNEAQGELKGIHDACLLDWNGAKVVNLNGNALLDDYSPIGHRKLEQQNNTIEHLSTNWSFLSFFLNNNNKSSQFINQNLLELTYLSISSLLSIFGILINLFIILIIIFNTKQKRSSVIRSNNTNQNNLLLLQLTLTGILLSCYVLLENLGIQNDSAQFNFSNKDLEFPSSQISNSKHSPLFNFLPSTPFHLQSTTTQFSYSSSLTGNPNYYQQLLEYNSSDKLEVSDSFKRHRSSQLNANKLQNFAVIINYNPDFSSLSSAPSQGNEDPANDMIRETPVIGDDGPWYLEYYVLGDSDNSQDLRSKRRLINLSGYIESISTGEFSCRQDGGVDNNKLKVEVEGSTDSRDQYGRSEIESNIKAHSNIGDRCGGLKLNGLLLLLMKLLPFFMNVLASVHIWTVAALAYDRYCAIAHPLQYLRSLHTSRVRTFFIVSWSVALLLNLLWPLTLNQIISFEWTSQIQESSLHKDNLRVFHGERNENVYWDGGGELLDSSPNININLNNGSQLMGKCQFTTTTTNCFPFSYDKNCRNVALSIGDTYQTLRSFLVQFGDVIDTRRKLVGIGKNKSQSLLAAESDEIMERIWVEMRNSLLIELTTRALFMVGQPSSRSSSLDVSRTNENSSSSRSSSSSMKTSKQPQLTRIRFGNDMSNEEEITSDLYIILLLTYSLLGFLVIILIPLLIITVCNIMIYKIVKVHERRLSFNSGSYINTSASNLNYSHNYQVHHSYHQPQHNNNLFQQQQQQQFHHHQQKLRSNRRDTSDERSETSSITSLLVAKLFKFGFLRGNLLAKQAEDQLYCSHPNKSAEMSQQSLLSTGINNCNKCRECDRNSNTRLDCQNIDKSSEQQQFDLNNQNATIVNRSKRMIIRQDSYQILTKLNTNSKQSAVNQVLTTTTNNGGQSINMNDTNNLCSSDNKSSNVYQASSLINHPPHHFKRSRIKRKCSDHTLGGDSFLCRKDSNASQPSDFREFDVTDNHSLFNDSPITNTEHQANKLHLESSEGIMNQLKLAGLSFAGIAIHRSSSSALGGFIMGGKQSLLKSSSCSLNSLNAPTQNQMQPNINQMRNCVTSVSRCSMDTSSSVHTFPRKSYVSLHNTSSNNNSSKQQQDFNNCKYLARLLDDDSDGAQTSQVGVQHHFNHNNSSRLPSTLGTKSPAFNVVIWLILSLLIFTLPYYILETVQQVGKLKSPHTQAIDLADAQFYKQLLDTSVKFILGNDSDGVEMRNFNKNFESKNEQKVNQNQQELFQQDPISGRSSKHFWEITSIWLACICRILFLSIVPLNGWLYGIRSRSLRATLRIVLRRYISRRQASIEINQRQRSISSIRSRDSSFMNLPPWYYNHNSSICAKCNYQGPTESPERLFRRCSSYDNFKRENRLRENSSSQAFIVDDNPAEEIRLEDDNNMDQPTHELVIKSRGRCNIRFSIGDSSSDRDSNTPTPMNINRTVDNARQYCSQSTSPAISLAGSDRSLVSASIFSAHSLLFDDRRCQEYSPESKYLRQKSLNKQTIEACGTSVSSTKITHDGLDKKISELDQTLKIILVDNRFNSNSNDSSRIEIENQPVSKNISNSVQAVDRPFNLNFQQLNSKNVVETNTVEAQRQSSSSVEPAKPSTTPLNRHSSDYTKNNHLKKSSSEFRFFITSADQEQHIIDFDRDDSTPTKRDITTNFKTSGFVQTKLAEIDNRQLSSGHWWNKLKNNLTKIVLNASTRLLPSNLNEPQRRAMSKCCITGANWHDGSDQMADTEDQCDKALLRKNTSDEQKPEWFQKQRVNNGLRLSRKQISLSTTSTDNKRKRKKRLRNSLTLDNIESIKNNEYISHLRCSSHQANHASGSNKTLDQSPTYLKPPNFLKLIFDSNNHTSPYSGSSALSPIKECSSNHSYASSQSSLSNNYLANNLLKNPSIDEQPIGMNVKQRPGY